MKTCRACGRTCETRYEWAHHGCEVPGGAREANRRARAAPPAAGGGPPVVAAADWVATLPAAPR